MKKFVWVWVILTLSAFGAIAQEATPEPEIERTEVGALSVILPEGWFAFTGQNATTIIASDDLTQYQGDYPENIVLMQISTGTLDQLAGMIDSENPTALDILKAIPTPEGRTFTYEEVTIEDVLLGRVDASEGENESIIYTRLLGEKGFAFIVTAGTSAGALANFETELQGVVASMVLNVTATFPEGTETRYADFPQSTTEEGFPLLGNPDAKVRLYEISSFDCPHCRTFHDTALPVLLDLIKSGDVAFVYVPLFGTGGIPNGDRAARAALCAGEQGQFWAFHDGVFSWQEFGTYAFMQERLDAGIEALALDQEAYVTCFDSEATTQTLSNAVEYAYAIEGFRGTPTVVLNGQIVAWTPLEGFLLLINNAIAGE